MTTITIFLVLTIIQSIYIWFQWDKISTAVEVTKFAAENIQVHKKQGVFIRWVGKLFTKFKKVIWIPITIILFGNLIVSSILAFIYTLIMGIIHLF